jgi:hypothetical protein
MGVVYKAEQAAAMMHAKANRNRGPNRRPKRSQRRRGRARPLRLPRKSPEFARGMCAQSRTYWIVPGYSCFTRQSLKTSAGTAARIKAIPSEPRQPLPSANRWMLCGPRSTTRRLPTYNSDANAAREIFHARLLFKLLFTIVPSSTIPGSARA